ncbi:hypothetical protein [Vitiosangium sp. GDMCC 1.1324]|uniref:hypothetical protein n=1 Tax=Vitiosangium sp. (strain GDMCC 1.1324) TaxID=2138576 RepID=UPI000D3BBAE1|nr:hypothetical protein [Vitiosangium sp. GDMCC 1.1324]PTL82891.1 hypothetical protein DAT35_12705 [Vitiosangium sp. GDMCC 1.1324]
MAGLAGCGSTEEGLEQGLQRAPVEQAALKDDRAPPKGLNGTSPSCFWANGTQQALRTLGGIALDQGAGFLSSIPLSQVSQSCRSVLRSAVECALTREQSVRDPVTGELYTGWWGLAPSWLGNVLDTQGRRYVTACMVQRLNYYGTSVPILFEGLHSAIARNPAYDSEYPIEESTVFGDLFSSTTPLLGLLPAFNVYVCWESLLPQSCGLLGLPLLLEKRICDDVPLCGVVTLGPCALSCVQNGPYWKCGSDLLSPPTWTETVRVKLETATCQ